MAKSVLRGKILAINAYIKKKKKDLKQRTKNEEEEVGWRRRGGGEWRGRGEVKGNGEEETKSKVSRREILKIRAEINEIQKRKKTKEELAKLRTGSL